MSHMADVHNKKTRSYNMSRIRSKNTKPEIVVRKYLFSKGFRFRIHAKYLPGHPDLVLAKYKTVIFVNGCFWHGHEGCFFSKIPSTRNEWWQKKIEYTKERDISVYHQLLTKGWKVLLVWECELKKDAVIRMEKLINEIRIE